jgi:hypothetical protein
MQCHGSAHLELAIPGYVEPVRDDMAGAKGVGTRMHSSFQPLCHWSVVDLDYLQELVANYSRLDWRIRRKLMEDITTTDTESWAYDVFAGGCDWDWLRSTALPWLRDLDQEERLPPLMLRYVVDTIEKLKELLDRLRPDFYQVLPERAIQCSWLRSNPLTTPDIVIVQRKTLVIVDYKTGKIPVSPVDNYQLMFYARSALEVYYPRLTWDDLESIEMHIWQPGSHTVWETDVQHILQWSQLAAAADYAIERMDLTLTPGSHCTFCPANPHGRGDKAPPYCPAMMAVLYPDTTDEEGILDLD